MGPVACLLVLPDSFGIALCAQLPRPPHSPSFTLRAHALYHAKYQIGVLTMLRSASSICTMRLFRNKNVTLENWNSNRAIQSAQFTCRNKSTVSKNGASSQAVHQLGISDNTDSLRLHSQFLATKIENLQSTGVLAAATYYSIIGNARFWSIRVDTIWMLVPTAVRRGPMQKQSNNRNCNSLAA